jgi:hypothetical protein
MKKRKRHSVLYPSKAIRRAKKLKYNSNHDEVIDLTSNESDIPIPSNSAVQEKFNNNPEDSIVSSNEHEIPSDIQAMVVNNVDSQISNKQSMINEHSTIDLTNTIPTEQPSNEDIILNELSDPIPKISNASSPTINEQLLTVNEPQSITNEPLTKSSNSKFKRKRHNVLYASKAFRRAKTYQYHMNKLNKQNSTENQEEILNSTTISTPIIKYKTRSKQIYENKSILHSKNNRNLRSNSNSKLTSISKSNTKSNSTKSKSKSTSTSNNIENNITKRKLTFPKKWKYTPSPTIQPEPEPETSSTIFALKQTETQVTSSLNNNLQSNIVSNTNPTSIPNNNSIDASVTNSSIDFKPMILSTTKEEKLNSIIEQVKKFKLIVQTQLKNCPSTDVEFIDKLNKQLALIDENIEKEQRNLNEMKLKKLKIDQEISLYVDMITRSSSTIETKSSIHTLGNNKVTKKRLDYEPGGEYTINYYKLIELHCFFIFII